MFDCFVSCGRKGDPEYKANQYNIVIQKCNEIYKGFFSRRC